MEGRTGGFEHNAPFFLLSTDLSSELSTEIEGGRQLGSPEPQDTTAAGEWGKTERGTRGFDSPTHLGRRWSEEGRPRRQAEVSGGSGGGRCEQAGGKREQAQRIRIFVVSPHRLPTALSNSSLRPGSTRSSRR
ncbi:unnamed protein product [Urochloa humidicola]